MKPGDIARQAEPSQNSGTGTAIAHHGELVQGVFEDERGRLHRALVTLPLARLRSEATFEALEDTELVVHPREKTKAAAAAGYTLEHLGLSRGGRLSIHSSIPVGHGYGSSTADVVASIRAVASAHDVKLRPSSVSRLAVAAERASDAIAYEDHAVLFAQREGVVIEDFGGALPPLLIVGFKAHGGLPIDTLHLPAARYDSDEIQHFRVLRGLVARGIRMQDPYLLGRAATVSAQISQTHLAKDRFETVIALAGAAGACGVQVAHSGSLMGVIFDLSAKGLRRKASMVAERARKAGFKDIETHLINHEGETWS